MRYARIIVLMALSAIMVATATSCKKDGKLVGKWEYKGEYPGENRITTLTFNKGGNGTMVDSKRRPTGDDSEGNPTNFTWTLNKTTLIITVSEEDYGYSSIGFFDGKMLIVGQRKFTKK